MRRSRSLITAVEVFIFYSKDESDRGNRRASESDYDKEVRI